LPDDACQCLHRGYVFKDKFRIRFTDGREVTASAGEAYYIPPGRRSGALEDVKLVEFSPEEELDKGFEVIGNIEAMEGTSS
jgi:hypothetical protein